MKFIDRQIKRFCILLGMLALSFALLADATEHYNSYRAAARIEIAVKASSACQGVFAKAINLSQLKPLK